MSATQNSATDQAASRRRARTQATLVAVSALLAAPLLWALPSAPVSAAEEATVIPAPAMDAPLAASGKLATAIVAGGCFWGVQAVFQHTEGVSQAVSGYAGGSAETAVYEKVGSGQTGHAEAVRIEYDPAQISYGQILQIFFSVAHDPTEVDRQGPDVGSQYRSAIFTTDAEQAKIADAYIDQLDAAGVYPEPIATEVGPLEAFYAAEDYHQDYATLHPDSAYIFYNDLPKIANLKELFPAVFRDEPALVFPKGAS